MQLICFSWEWLLDVKKKKTLWEPSQTMLIHKKKEIKAWTQFEFFFMKPQMNQLLSLLSVMKNKNKKIRKSVIMLQKKRKKSVISDMGYLNHYLCICCIVNAEEENRFALLNKAVAMFHMLNWLAFMMAGGDDKFEERNTCRSQTNEPWISIADTFGRWWGSLPWSMFSQGVMIFWTRKVELKVMLADERGQNLEVDWWMKNNLLGCVEIFFVEHLDYWKFGWGTKMMLGATLLLNLKM